MTFLKVDIHDPLPIYAQLERAIKSAIATGAMKAGDQLPTVRQLAVELRLNANTIARVYAELERQGVVATRRGVGTFVQASPNVAVPRSERAHALHALVQRFLAEAAASGFTADELIEQIKRFPLKQKDKSHAKR